MNSFVVETVGDVSNGNLENYTPFHLCFFLPSQPPNKYGVGFIKVMRF